MSSVLLYIALQTFSVLAALFALVKGGKGERWAAGVVLLNLVIGTSAAVITRQNVEIVRLANDGLAPTALLVITLRYGAFWLGAAMLLFAAGFAVHSFYIVTERALDLPYVVINVISWNGLIWCLIIGTIIAWTRRIRGARAAATPAPAA